MMTNLQKMEEDGYGYITKEALGRDWILSLYSDDCGAALDTYEDNDLIYIEYQNGSWIAMGWMDDSGDELVFGVSDDADIITQDEDFIMV
jgi:hypothetical protein